MNDQVKDIMGSFEDFKKMAERDLPKMRELADTLDRQRQAMTPDESKNIRIRITPSKWWKFSKVVLGSRCAAFLFKDTVKIQFNTPQEAKKFYDTLNNGI